MRRIFIAALVAIAVVACNDNKKGNGKLDPSAMISLRPDAKQAANAATRAGALTPLEVVKQATDMWFWNVAIQPGNALGRGFDIGQKDTVNVRLLMFGTDIISQQGEYVSEFIEGTDVVITKVTSITTMDTIAYIPNSILRKNQPLIKAAFDIQEYETCYALFDQAFVFIPITGAEWRELKAQGLN